MELAERLDRLWAAVIDRLIYVIFTASLAIAVPALNGSSYFTAIIIIGIVALLSLTGVQIWLLTTQGQTIGKKIIGLRIVKITDMTNGGFVTNVLLRVIVGLALSIVPFLGVIFALGDPLAIFRQDRRCLHDHIAGTCVIKA